MRHSAEIQLDWDQPDYDIIQQVDVTSPPKAAVAAMMTTKKNSSDGKTVVVGAVTLRQRR